jgi:hypothetical protein
MVMSPVTVTVTRTPGSPYGHVTVDIPEGAEEVTITAVLLRQLVAALNERGAAYREGYNECARAQQRTLIEYGGRPSVPAGSGGMTSDVQMDEVEGL